MDDETIDEAPEAHDHHAPHPPHDDPRQGGDVGPRGEPGAGGDADPAGAQDAALGDVGQAATGDDPLYDTDPDSFDPAEPLPGLSHKQEQTILALLAEPTVARAAKTAGVGARTLHRWLREDAFGRAYRLARRETFSQAVSLTQRYAGLAVQTLAKVMTDSSSPGASRVAAATSMLKFARESIELDELVERVEALERAAKERAA